MLIYMMIDHSDMRSTANVSVRLHLIMNYVLHIREGHVCVLQIQQIMIMVLISWTFTLHLCLAAFFVFLLRDPHLLKGSQGRQN